ncbi:MAG: decaprenyl-phosphate phosphoribosyltransferase [Candidatus Omnitrophica bacterium]|nr:decaprenyl-phosphate phosphoribosyltransferase [Candidatus Omnitrophota bacterium]
MKNKIKFLCDLLRVKQWVKNAFIFFPLIFSGKLFLPASVINCVITFLGFCLVASGLYIFNDYLDRHKDRLHPRKADRPLTRMEVGKPLISLLVGGLIGVGLLACWQVDPMVLLVALGYILLHLVYNLFAKMIVIIDVVFIALGFQVRIWAGAVAITVMPSVWLQMCVFLLALFLGFTKRRYEMKTLGEHAVSHRNVLSHYTVYLLDQIIIVCSTLAIVFYGLYAMSPDIVNRIGSQDMVYSVVFVIYGIFRYLYLSHVKKKGDDAGEALASDAPLLVNVLLWILYICFLLYNPLR